MRAGQLRHRVRIESPTEAQNEYGETIRSWTLLAERWASIEGVGGGERAGTEQQEAIGTHLLRLRYVEGLDAKCRIVFGSRVFGVGLVANPEERNEELALQCTEVKD